MLQILPRSLGNIVTGTDEQTDAVIKAGALPILGKLLQHSRMNLVKEVRTARKRTSLRAKTSLS